MAPPSLWRVCCPTCRLVATSVLAATSVEVTVLRLQLREDSDLEGRCQILSHRNPATGAPSRTRPAHLVAYQVAYNTSISDGYRG